MHLVHLSQTLIYYTGHPEDCSKVQEDSHMDALYNLLKLKRTTFLAPFEEEPKFPTIKTLLNYSAA